MPLVISPPQMDLVKVAGTATDVNAGDAGAGTLRAVLADDQHRIPVTAQRQTCIVVPNTAGAHIQTPDAAIFDILGDLDMRVAWRPAQIVFGSQFAVSKWGAAGQRSYLLGLDSTGHPILGLSSNGTLNPTHPATATLVSVGFNQNDLVLQRATLDVDNGASGYTVTHYYKRSTEATAASDLLSNSGWKQLGSPVVTAGVTSIFASTAPPTIGDGAAGSALAPGRYFAAAIFSGIDVAASPVSVLDFTDGTRWYRGITAAIDDQGNTWTVAGTATLVGTVQPAPPPSPRKEGCILLPNTAGANVASPDAATFDILADIDLRVALRMDDVASGGTQVPISKWNTSQQAYAIDILSTGLLLLAWSTTGANTLTATSTATLPSVGFTNRDLILLRATLDVDNGASGRTARFFYKRSTEANAASDLFSNSGWQQLGDDVVTAGTTSIFASTANVLLGDLQTGSFRCPGRYYAAAIVNGIGDAGTYVSCLDLTDEKWSTGATSGTDDQGNTWTINGTASVVGRAVSTVHAGASPFTPGLSTNRQPALTNTAVAVKATAGKLYGYNIFNPGTALAYVHFYDVASGSVTVGTTTPKLSIALPSNASAFVGDDTGFGDIPVDFTTAITIAASTTPGGGTAPGTALVTNLYYA